MKTKEQLFNENYEQFNSCITYHLNNRYYNLKTEHSDLRQEVLMKLYNALEKFDEAKAKLITFVNTIIINTLATLVNKFNRQNMLLVDDLYFDEIEQQEHIDIFEKAEDLLYTITLTRTERTFLEMLVAKHSREAIKIALNLTDNYLRQLVCTIKKKVINNEYKTI